MKKLVTMLDGIAMQKEGNLTEGWEFLQMVSAEQIPPQEIRALVHEARATFNESSVDASIVRASVIRPHERLILNMLRQCLEKHYLLENMTDTIGSTPLSLAQSWDKQIIVSTINTPFRIENAIAASMATKPMRCSLVGCVNMGFLDSDGVVYYSFRQLNDEPEHNSVKRTREDLKTHGMIIDVGEFLTEYAARDDGFNKRLRAAEQAKEVRFCKIAGRVAKGKLTAELWDMFMRKCLNVGPPYEYTLNRAKKHTEQEQQEKPKREFVSKRNFMRIPLRPITSNQEAGGIHKNNSQDGDEPPFKSRSNRSFILWSEIERIVNQNNAQRSQNKPST